MGRADGLAAQVKAPGREREAEELADDEVRDRRRHQHRGADGQVAGRFQHQERHRQRAADDATRQRGHADDRGQKDIDAGSTPVAISTPA